MRLLCLYVSCLCAFSQIPISSPFFSLVSFLFYVIVICKGGGSRVDGLSEG